MRKILLILLVGMLVFGSFHTIASRQPTQLSEQMNATFYQLKTIDKESHVSLELKGADDLFVMQNHYMVPSRIETFTFPYGTTVESVSVIPNDINEVVIEKSLEVAPAARLTDQSGVVATFDSEPVAISDWHSYDVGAGVFNDQHCTIVKVQLFPVQYNPQDNVVQWAEELSIDVTYVLPDVMPTAADDEEFEFIILTANEFSSELNPLVTHKNNRGLSTKLVTLTDIYNSVYFPAEGRDDAEEVKYFIKNAFEQWSTRYVMLVGGYDYFPSRETHVYVSYGSGDAEVFVSDLYFADILDEEGFSSWDSNNNDVFGEFDWGSDRLNDDVDVYPEVGVGRLAAISSTQVANVVDKIISYETQESYKKDWFSTVLYCGGDTFPGDGQAVDEGEYFCDYISNFMNGFSANKLYVTQGTLRTNIDISDGVGEGSGFFILAGHASPTSWSTHPHENANVWIPTSGFRSANAANLNNGEKLPILLTESCSPFKYAASDECLGWSFLSNPNGGMITGFGATGLSWGSTGTGVVSSLTARLLIETLKAYKKDGAITPGEMWMMGINKYYKPHMDGGAHKSVEEWQMLGDPSLSIAEDSQAPLKPEVPEGPSSGSAGETYSYSSSTTDPEGDDIYYLFDWGDGTDSGWLGPYDSGRLCAAEYTWSSSGSYEIKVKSQDFHGVVSEWSDPLTVSMPKGKLTPMIFFERLLQQFPLLQFFFN